MTEPIHVERIMHTIHAVRDMGACRRRYQDVFGAMVFNEGYEPTTDRDHALLYAADHMIEPMSPRAPDDLSKSFARYLDKFGEGWHSFEVKVADAAKTASRLKGAGCNLIETPYPVFFFVRAESTGGILYEVCEKPMRNDPHDRPNWNPDWGAGGPCGLVALDHIACVVKDMGVARHFFTQLFDGKIIAEDRIATPQPATRLMIELGGTRVALIAPDDAASGPIGAYLGKPCSGIYALVWRIEDEARARTAFAAEGLTLSDADCAGGDFAIDPARFQGARHEFLVAESA